RELRNQLFTLRNKAQDFRFGTVFAQFNAASSEETALTAEISGANPVLGSYEINVVQLASATGVSSNDALGAAIDPNAALSSSGIAQDISAGTFSINGVSFTVDPATDSLNSILATITASAAGVNASYDVVTDKVTFANQTPGDTSVIIFGGGDDDSNFLEVLNVAGATQSNGPSGETQATSTRNLGAVNAGDALNDVQFAGGAVTSGNIRINGVTISVDAANDSIADVLARINDSDAQVTASYDTATDTIRVVSNTLGSRTIRFQSDGSNFLDVVNLTTATQSAGRDAQFTVNGGAVQTRSTNEVSDAVGGVTLRLLSVGTSTVTISSDNEGVIEKVREFLSAYNDTVDKIEELTGSEGALAGDNSLRLIVNTLRSVVFNRVTGYGNYKSLPEIGITTGDAFESTAVAHLELDEEAFLEALQDDRINIVNLFSNSAGTGIADALYSYTDEISRTTGFLNARIKSSGSIDVQIRSLNDRIDQLEKRLTQKESRLRRQFGQLEQLTATYQQQGSSLTSLASRYQVY
ncbi:MAG TPA: hypothetical protein ENN80_09665, partial [Candidatus Hydrogenedentes bacterium]|nr:hypothetical protein [Candidatus Hydrogenedentota bacterium]